MRTPSTSSKRQLVADYLREEASRTDGSLYVKSKFIAEEIDLSAKEIGWSIRSLAETHSEFEIEKWSYTGATTWRISIDHS